MNILIKTFKDLQDIDLLVSNLYSKDKTLEKSKFGYAYKRFIEKNYMPAIKEMQEKLSDVRINNALEDKNTKEILITKENSRGFKYSKEGLKKCVAEERKTVDEFEKKEIEIIPFISSYVPEGLSEEDKELLTGLVI
ncbi:MAG: hypothetical protein WC437_04730 [Patescibacteria group bacterium]|jgi:hypothetical protein